MITIIITVTIIILFTYLFHLKLIYLFIYLFIYWDVDLFSQKGVLLVGFLTLEWCELMQ